MGTASVARQTETEGAAGVRAVLDSYPGAGRDALIPILQKVQEQQGFLSREAVVMIGRHLKLPASKVYGVATFYNQFRFQPKGKYHFMVCRGTACHVKGSLKVLETVQRLLKLKPGQTSRDKLFSLEVVACMGGCGLSPVVNINGEFYAKVTPQKLAAIIQECREKEAVHV
jgi:NADH-quinone oxidoreductase subunit E